MRRYLHPVVAAVVLTAGVPTASHAAAQDDGGKDDVLAWNAFTVSSFLSPPTTTIPAPAQPVYLAYLHRAVDDAVGGTPDWASVPAAVAAAARGVLRTYFPSHTEVIDDRYAAELAAVPDGPAEARGVAVGEQAARKLVKERTDDGLNGPALPLTPPEPGPGVWQPIPAAPSAAASWLGTVRPFVLDSPSEFRPGPPPALTSDRWVHDYREVMDYGSDGLTFPTLRTAEQTTVGKFWSDPPGVQSQRALRLFAQQRADLGADETARLFALVNTASADALIACADAKFAYDFWRPIGAIRGVPADDGATATAIDADWAPLVATPNFPEYPSNHSCVTTAIATMIDVLDGRRHFSYVMSSTVTGSSVTFRSAAEMIGHVADGRVWSGLHWRFATDAGTDLGRAVAHSVLRAEG